MRYTIRAAACFLLVCWAAIARADIEVKPHYDDHEPITPVLTVENMPEGAVLRKTKFKCPGATVIPVSESSFHIWAPPGKYTIEATGTWRLYQTITDKQDKEWKVIADEDDYEFLAAFTVAGEVPPPQPIVNPYKPAPQFQAAAQPVKALSLSKADSQALAGMYATVAAQARAGAYKSLGEIRADLVKRGQLLNLKGKYANLSPSVEQYLVACLGLEEAAPAAGAGDVLETLAWAVFETGRAGR